MPNRKYDPMMGMSKGDDLPEGISMDETGVLEWEYVQNMWANIILQMKCLIILINE